MLSDFIVRITCMIPQLFFQISLFWRESYSCYLDLIQVRSTQTDFKSVRFLLILLFLRCTVSCYSEMEKSLTSRKWGTIKPADIKTLRTERHWLENVLPTVKPNASKTPLTLTIGNPVIYSAFEPENTALEILSDSIGEATGYTSPGGDIECRKYLAQAYSTETWKLTEDDIFLGAGCNGVLNQIHHVLADPGDTVLLPKVLFPLMKAISINREVNVDEYEFLPEKNWEVNLKDLEERLAKKPKFVYFLNPSNPLGSVWSADHVSEILSLANKYKVPVVTDEIYEGLIFSNSSFNSFGKLSKGQPVFVCSGYSKMGLAPGWRLGWAVCYGKPEIIAPIKKALAKTSLYSLKCNSAVQVELPKLVEASFSYIKAKSVEAEKRAKVFEEALEGCPGISVFKPSGTMFAIIRIRYDEFVDIKSSRDFAIKLLEEENINILPGHLFGDDDFIRVVILDDEEVLREFGTRTREFVMRHIVRGEQKNEAK